MSGRTVWLAKDADWHVREWLVELGEEFGPAGPLAIDWLECAAKRQSDGGFVKFGLRSLARGVYSDLVTVGHVVSRSVTLGLLTEHREECGLVTCRISWWEADQERALWATRKARQRSANTGDSSPLVTVGPAMSPNVPLTGQDRTEERANALSSSDADAPDPTSGSSDEREREKASDDDRRLCRLLAERIRARNPKAKIGSDVAWLRSMRLMRERDGHTVQEIEQVISWLFTDPGQDAAFWADTIQSASGLRDHFGQVWVKMSRQVSGNVVRAEFREPGKYDRAAGLA